MTEPAVLPAPRKRRRRWLLLLVPLALVAAAWLYMYSASDRRLAQVAAETDRLDPHWRLDDIQAERATIPDEENGARTVIAVKAKRPAGWPWWEVSPTPPRVANPELNPRKELEDLKPNEALPDWARDAMRPEMELAAA